MFGRKAAAQDEQIYHLNKQLEELDKKLHVTNAHLAALIGYLASADPVIYAEKTPAKEAVLRLHMLYLATGEGVFPGASADAEQAMLVVERAMREGRRNRLSPPS